MVRRKLLDKYYAEGRDAGRRGIPPDPIRMDRYYRMAYDAGWHDGQRERTKYEADLQRFIDERISAGHKG